MAKNNENNDKFRAKNDIQSHRKVLFIKLEVSKPLKIEKRLEVWALGCHPAMNGHVTY